MTVCANCGNIITMCSACIIDDYRANGQDLLQEQIWSMEADIEELRSSRNEWKRMAGEFESAAGRLLVWIDKWNDAKEAGALWKTAAKRYRQNAMIPSYEELLMAYRGSNKHIEELTAALEAIANDPHGHYADAVTSFTTIERASDSDHTRGYRSGVIDGHRCASEKARTALKNIK